MDYILHILGFIEMILMLLVKVFAGVSLVLIAVFAIIFAPVDFPVAAPPSQDI